jgi:excisionase family DNA binding protein
MRCEKPQSSVVVIKVEDLARMLSIGRNTAYELVRSGRIRSIKIGRTYRIPLSAVEDYLNASDETGIM